MRKVSKASIFPAESSRYLFGGLCITFWAKKNLVLRSYYVELGSVLLGTNDVLKWQSTKWSNGAALPFQRKIHEEQPMRYGY